MLIPSLGSLFLCLLPGAWAHLPQEDTEAAEVRIGDFRAERPDPDGVPTRILLSFYTTDIEAIDDLTQSFTADVFVAIQWDDPRLALEEGAEAGPRQFALSDIWTPELVLYNQRSLEKRLPERAMVSPSGHVRYRQRLYGTFTAPLELREFPMDRQTLPITAVSMSYGPDEVSLELVNASRDPSFSITGWHVGDGEMRSGTLTVQSAEGPVELVRLDFEFSAERQMLFYALKVIGPLSLIMCMALIVFLLGSIETSVQIRVSTTACLTLIAFLFGLGQFLPPISYLTRLDYFVFQSLALVFLAFMKVMLCVALRNKDRAATADGIDMFARWLFILGFAWIQYEFWF